jgi:phage gp29-like protein
MGDDRVSAVLGVRVRGLLGLPFRLEPVEGGEKAAGLLEARWWGLFPEDALYDLMAWGLLTGVGLAAVVWEEGDGRLWPRLEVWNPGALRYDPQQGWRVVDREGREHPVEGPGWLLYTPYGPKRPWEKGLWRSLTLPWLAKTDAIRYWARDNEVGAIRVAYADGPAGSTGEELARTLSELGTDTGLVLPDGWRMEMLSPSGDVWRSKEALIQWANQAIAVAVLGQNLTTEVQGGSYAAARVHGQVRQDLLEADAEYLSTALRNGVLRTWAEWNLGDPELAPWPKWDYTPPEDQAAKADTLQKLSSAVAAFVQAGMPVDLYALAQEFGLPVLEQKNLVRLASGAKPAEAPGFVQGQLYTDAVNQAAVDRLPNPLEPFLNDLLQAESYEEVMAVVSKAARNLSPEEAVALTERALLMASLAGRYSVVRDVER